MKLERALLLSVPLVMAGCGPEGGATASPSPSPSPMAASPMVMASPTVDAVVMAEVVSVDVPARSLTLRERAMAGASPAAPVTVAVDPSALAALDALHPGDPVDVTCRTETMPVAMGSPGMMGAPAATSPGMASPGMRSPGMASPGMASMGMATITSCRSVIGVVKGSPAPRRTSPRP